MAEPIVIHIQPIDDDLIDYVVYLGPLLLLGPTPTPYIDAANRLLYIGYDPERRLLMRRRGVDVNQLNYELADAARLGFENEQIIPASTLYPIGQDGPGIVP